MGSLRKIVGAAAVAAGLAAIPTSASAIQVCTYNTPSMGFISGQYWVINTEAAGNQCTYRYVVYYTVKNGPATVEGGSGWAKSMWGLRTSRAVQSWTPITVVQQSLTPAGQLSQSLYTTYAP